MPSRQRWCPPRRRSSAAQQAAEVQLEDDDAAANALGTMGCAAPNLSAEALLNEEPIMLQIARQLWRPDYEALFRAEHAASLERLGPGYRTERSSYAQRLKGVRLAAYERRLMARERDQMAIALHSANMRAWNTS